MLIRVGGGGEADLREAFRRSVQARAETAASRPA